jgi:hypothetical protein
MMNDVNRLFSI